jgi:HPt (histidine-containing phosphotransfer) domain-containing protein
MNAPDTACCNLASHETAKSLPSAVLDMESLRNRCMGNLDLVQRLLKTFHERMPLEMDAMEEALKQSDAEAVARLAHRVRGSSASMSADGLTRAATEIEIISRSGSVEDIPASIEHLRDEWEKYLEYGVALLSKADNT